MPTAEHLAVLLTKTRGESGGHIWPPDSPLTLGRNGGPFGRQREECP
jgi:hypothetical protein